MNALPAETGITGRSSYLHSPPRKVPCWKGRTPYPFPAAPNPQHHHPTAQQCAPESSTADGCPGRGTNSSGSCHLNARLLPQKYQLLHQLMAQLESGEVHQVMQQLEEELGAEGLSQDPELLFKLHR